MKKAKIMLTLLAVVSIVGAGLAFKAKTYTTNYCTSTTSVGLCASTTIQTYKLQAGGTPFYYTVIPAGAAAPSVKCTTVNCGSFATFAKE